MSLGLGLDSGSKKLLIQFMYIINYPLLGNCFNLKFYSEISIKADKSTFITTALSNYCF